MALAGSVTNLIVADQVAPLGVRLGCAEHARPGAPATLLALGVLSTWLLV